MRGRFALLLLLAAAALAGLGWLAWRANRPARDALAPEDARALAAPTPEQLAALDSAEARAHDAVEAPSAGSRASMEERTFKTRAATITVQPPKVESENRGMIIVWCYVESSRASIAPDEIAVVTPDGREIVQKRGKQQDTFRGLAPVLYSVVVRDARFESVRVDSVPTGSHVLVDLLGTASIRPHALDAETGAALDASGLRFLDLGPKRELEPDAQGWFTGLPFGNFKVRVSAPGYEPAELVAADLAPGEAREVELRFTRAGEIRGVALGEVDGLPVPNVVVAAIEAAGSGWRVPERTVRSDDQGRFSILDLRFGEYTVQARRGSALPSPGEQVKLSQENRVQEIVLRLPPVASLDGKLACIAGGATGPNFGDFRISVGQIVTSVAANGTFEFQDCLPVGRTQVRLRLRSGSISRALGEVVLRSGTNECSFDVSEFLPGDATVEIIGNGLTVDGGSLLLAAHDGGGNVETFQFGSSKGVVGPLPAGDYLMLARGGSGEWMTSTPIPLRIEPGKVAEARLELRLARGRLALQDLGGAPLSQGTRVALIRVIAGWPTGGVGAELVLGEDGMLELALEPGTITLGLDVPRNVVWTASGPAEPVLRLAPR